MVLVVDHTLVMVSRSHGLVFSASAQPPQMSTTGSPWRKTATDAPRSAPESSWPASVVRTPSKRGSQVPCTSAMPMVPPLLAVSRTDDGNLGTGRPPGQWAGAAVLGNVGAMERADAVVVGSGPNGLAAALTLARAGHRGRGVRGRGDGRRRHPHRGADARGLPPRRLLGRAPRPGGLALLPHPRPAGARLVLRQPEVAFAQPLGGGRAAAAYRDVGETASHLGGDAAAYAALDGAAGRTGSTGLWRTCSSPMRSLPRDPLALARFAAGRHAVDPPRHPALHDRRRPGAAGGRGGPLHGAADGAADGGVRRCCSPRSATARAGRWSRVAAPPSRGAGGRGAPPRGHGAHGDLGRLAGRRSPRRGPSCSTPHRASSSRWPASRLSRRAGPAVAALSPGPGTCKVDWALDGPVPWSAEACRRTVTVHVGGTFDEVARCRGGGARRAATPSAPFVLVAQPCVVDPTRAPAGKHTLWGYCHVPNGSSVDMSERMEAQIERFAPGFRDLIAGAGRAHGGRGGGLRPQPARRRRQRRRADAAPDGLPARGAVEPVPDAGGGGLSLLGLDPARRRGARDVRRGGGRGGPAGTVRLTGAQRPPDAQAIRRRWDRRSRSPAPGGTRPRSRRRRRT